MKSIKPNKAIVISPHRDDAVISIGGYVYKNYQDVVVLNIFTQSVGAIIKIPDNKISQLRRKEDNAIAKKWNFKFLDCHFSDSSLRNVRWNNYRAKVDLELLKGIQKCIFDRLNDQKSKYDLYIPASYGLHPDHYLCTLAFSSGKLFELLKKINFFVYCDQQYYYEGKAFHEGHRYLNRQAALNTYKFNPEWKRKMVSVYRSQLSPKRIKLLTSTIKNEYFWETSPIFFKKSKRRIHG